jgi:hypothetical protein
MEGKRWKYRMVQMMACRQSKEYVVQMIYWMMLMDMYHQRLISACVVIRLLTDPTGWPHTC